MKFSGTDSKVKAKRKMNIDNDDMRTQKMASEHGEIEKEREREIERKGRIINKKLIQL